MKVTSLGLPTVEDIKDMPCFKQKNLNTIYMESMLIQ